MRSIWKGHIKFSLVTIPIQIFNALESSKNISFKQIHAADRGAVGYRKICKECDETLSSKDIVKGYEYEPDQFVLFDAEELKQVKLKSTRAIDIEAFVDINEVHPSRYEAVYFVGPNGDVAQSTYALFRESLKRSGKAGIGRIILRDREDVVLLAPHEEGLIMYKLRYPYEVRTIKDVPDIQKAEVSDDQLKLADTLIDSLATTFDKVNFEDRYRDALLDLVNQKVAGKEIVQIAEDDDGGAPVVDIMSALKASIDQAKKLKKGA